MKKNILLTSALGMLAGGLAYFIWGRGKGLKHRNEEGPTAREMVREGETRIHSAMHRAKEAAMQAKSVSN